MLRRIGVISLLAIAFTAPSADAQRPNVGPVEPGTSTIAGTVVDAQTKAPVAGVVVSVSAFTSGTARGARVTTGDDGAFAFVDIAEGLYLISTLADGYVNACHADPDARGPCGNINLLRDQKRRDITFALIKTATARGRVVDQNGGPVAGLQLRMAPVRPDNSFTPGLLPSASGAMTARDGTFEIRAAPGSWSLELELPVKPGSLRLPTVYYPGVFTTDEAIRVELIAGRTNDNLVFVLPEATANVLTVRVSPGAVEMREIATALIRPSPLVVNPITLNDEGTGSVHGLLEGRYFVTARGSTRDATWVAFEVAEFYGPMLDVNLQMAPAGKIVGRIVAQKGVPPPVDGVIVAAAWVHDDVEINPLSPDETHVAADGSFRIEGLFGHRSIRVVGLPEGWSVRSILQGRTDVTSGVDVPVDTTIDLAIVVSRQ